MYLIFALVILFFQAANAAQCPSGWKISDIVKSTKEGERFKVTLPPGWSFKTSIDQKIKNLSDPKCQLATFKLAYIYRGHDQAAKEKRTMSIQEELFAITLSVVQVRNCTILIFGILIKITHLPVKPIIAHAVGVDRLIAIRRDVMNQVITFTMKESVTLDNGA